MTILYIETNFLIAIAKGQDSQAEDLLYRPPNSVRIFIPNISANGINLEQNKLQNVCKLMLNEPGTLPIKKDIMDNLILQCILDHANSNSEKEKVFISGNSNDFGKPEVRETLRNAGIRYFTMTQQFLDWFNSRSSS